MRVLHWLLILIVAVLGALAAYLAVFVGSGLLWELVKSGSSIAPWPFYLAFTAAAGAGFVASGRWIADGIGEDWGVASLVLAILFTIACVASAVYLTGHPGVLRPVWIEIAASVVGAVAAWCTAYLVE